MAEEPRSLKATHNDAEHKRKQLEHDPSSNSPAYQDALLAAIKLYNQCLSLVDQISLFSPNETEEDINTAELQYLLLHYRIAEMTMRINGQTRKANLQSAQKSYEQFLKLLDNYDMLSKADVRLLEQFKESPNKFSTASTSDAAARRETKIRRFKEEKALQQKLDYLQSNPSVLQNDETAARELQMANIAYCTHMTFPALESIGQELHILSLAPSHPPADPDRTPADVRERNRDAGQGYSERLDGPLSHLSAGMRGPLLDSKGKPLRPFTLTSKRQEFRDGVFRPDHSLPTMSIDEYLEEERRRGGMIEGGGPQSEVRPQVDEDDMDAADRETMKAREWDEYVEANPKGSGNTLNRG